MIEEIFGWITHEDPVTKELLGHHRQEPCAVCAAKEHKKSLELLAAIIDTFNLALSAWSMAEQASEATRDRCANMAFEAMEGWYEDSKDKMRREAGLANSDILQHDGPEQSDCADLEMVVDKSGSVHAPRLHAWDNKGRCKSAASICRSSCIRTSTSRTSSTHNGLLTGAIQT
jgi:hypothetical protein